jgi:hypothetical protein
MIFAVGFPRGFSWIVSSIAAGGTLVSSCATSHVASPARGAPTTSAVSQASVGCWIVEYGRGGEFLVVATGDQTGLCGGSIALGGSALIAALRQPRVALRCVRSTAQGFLRVYSDPEAADLHDALGFCRAVAATPAAAPG